MRPITDDTRAVLAVHGSERVYEWGELVTGRLIYSCEDISTGKSIVYCATPELGQAVISYLIRHRFEIRDGAPIVDNGFIFVPERVSAGLKDATYGMKSFIVSEDSSIAKTILEALYIIGYSVRNS